MQDVVLRFVGGGGFLFNVNWLEFTPVPLTPPQLNWPLNGEPLEFNWPESHTGWRLQAQTNLLSSGLGTNWVTVAGSDDANLIGLPAAIPANGSVFYRLVFP